MIVDSFRIIALISEFEGFWKPGVLAGVPATYGETHQRLYLYQIVFVVYNVGECKIAFVTFPPTPVPLTPCSFEVAFLRYQYQLCCSLWPPASSMCAPYFEKHARWYVERYR